jgi:hypothetical protein
MWRLLFIKNGNRSFFFCHRPGKLFGCCYIVPLSCLFNKSCWINPNWEKKKNSSRYCFSSLQTVLSGVWRFLFGWWQNNSSFGCRSIYSFLFEFIEHTLLSVYAQQMIKIYCGWFRSRNQSNKIWSNFSWNWWLSR